MRHNFVDYSGFQVYVLGLTEQSHIKECDNISVVEQTNRVLHINHVVGVCGGKNGFVHN